MPAKKRTARTTTSHEDFYVRLRERVAGWANKSSIDPKYRDYVLALPDLFHLVVKLTMDKRVDAVSKAALGAAVAWAVMPFDILPDMLGPLGMVDDLLVLVLALDFMIDRTPRNVVQEHWAGSGDVFELIRNVLDKADEWMGRGLYQRVRTMVDHAIHRQSKAKPAPARKPAAERKTAAARTTAARKTTARKTTARKTTARKGQPAAAAARKKAPRKKSAARKTTKRRGSRA
jgi:uncharacterized membrane protein YkvA (DUF1232 family)